MIKLICMFYLYLDIRHSTQRNCLVLVLATYYLASYGISTIVTGWQWRWG